jgi:hypothetical protein
VQSSSANGRSWILATTGPLSAHEVLSAAWAACPGHSAAPRLHGGLRTGLGSSWPRRGHCSNGCCDERGDKMRPPVLKVGLSES